MATTKRMLAHFVVLLVSTFVSAFASAQSATNETIHHSLKVLVNPAIQYIAVEDTITLPDSIDGRNLSFLLNENLNITDSSVRMVAAGSADSTTAIGINSTGAETAASVAYSLSLSSRSRNRFELSYEGIIYQPTQQNSAQYSQSFSETSGIINDLGVYLNGASLWVPNFENQLVTFDLQVEFANGFDAWTVVSQGRSTGANSWSETNPMEEVYLVAADFTTYSMLSGDVDMLVYLRQPDSNLANKYLDATQRYLALYEPLLGEYPFSKFALVENFWETGYGMPSFTLLGQQVIRFPFIIDSSYPHEILHNWWGNGVYPDYDTGNWSEGLTAYLADHLFQEMNGLGHEYRKDNLIRYRNYVAEGSDFPLNQFTSRNSAASQAVGYGKTMMLWHMLRREIGDDLFLAGLRELYSRYQFQIVGFDEIAGLFSELLEEDMRPFFDQWVNRTGAPKLSLSVDDTNDDQARIMFTQMQDGAPYKLEVPIALYYASDPEPKIYEVSLTQKFEGVMADNFSDLQAVVVDPYFDLFRQLDREEIPPLIGQMFGSSAVSFIIPIENRQQWLQMAEAFAEGVDAEILMAEDLDQLPTDRSVWILGKDNPFKAHVSQGISVYGAQENTDGVLLAGSQVEFSNRSTVLTARHPENAEQAIGWIHIDDMVALPGMIEKLPHYGKYSYLSFIGSEPTNDVKGIWSSPASPMQWFAPGAQEGFQLPEIVTTEPLTKLPPKYLPESLLRHVSSLADDSMAGRKIGEPGIDQAARYIAERFRDIGLEPVAGTYIHEWRETIPGAGQLRMANVVAMLPGRNPALGASPVILGAHYDHLGQEGGQIHPGADDNASGISILIEIAARLQRSFSPQRPILFVAFSGEEAGLLGSRHFVEQPPRPFRSEDMFAMINLDSVGRLEGRPIQVFGADSAYEWPFMAQGIGFTIGVDSVMAEQVIASSDHVSFLNAGIPAIHVFAGVHPDYHRPSDRIETVDLTGMSDIALWVEEALVFLADREAPLRVNLSNAPAVPLVTGTVTQREASLGTVPDFSYGGEGIRLSDTVAGGAAEAAGILPGDILLRFNAVEVSDLQAYSNLIRETQVGDVIDLQIQRGTETIELQVTMQSR